eukprot:CAMPEP_0171641098 /NCGR_PEP_ID=MMETSP0990-20121206/30962_1 /TAXON_ID=483369 /ORGANISM="non described non described, Strain CCMP2098" /LENGTH=65 /DNA_ID=CAMNT_0012215673 /DNA_START=68 /DNA_END=265 /DNA_ORIENTATION=+
MMGPNPLAGKWIRRGAPCGDPAASRVEDDALRASPPLPRNHSHRERPGFAGGPSRTPSDELRGGA